MMKWMEEENDMDQKYKMKFLGFKKPWNLLGNELFFNKMHKITLNITSVLQINVKCSQN